jgi:hypothetical protein
MSWRTRLRQQPALQNMTQWPVIPAATLPARHRRGYLSHQRIVAWVLAHGSCTLAAQTFGVSKAHVSQLMNRCLGGDLQSPPALTQALVPHARLKPHARRQALPDLAKPLGTAGTFTELLAQLPSVKAGLDEAIRDDLRRLRASERLTAAGLHQRFLRLLAEAHWPATRYPYTHDSCARESVRRYLLRRRIEFQAMRGGKAAVAEVEAGLDGSRALATVQIDEHLMHLQTNLAIQFNDELIELRLSRCTLILAIDVATQCILGFTIHPTKAPNQDDLLSIFDRCLTPQAIPDIRTPGFDALPGPALPTEMSPFWPLTFGTVHFDNAWIHHAHTVEAFLADAQCGTLAFGVPALPTARWLVEHVFDYLERKLGHRFDSTTGSHPKDRKRESRRHAKAVPALSFHSLIEALYLEIGRYNNTPMAEMAGQRPLDAFQRHLREHWVRRPQGGTATAWQTFRSELVLPVHRPVAEKRSPYVHFCYARYSGDGLLSLAPDETRIAVDYDRRDIRTLAARTLQGRPLGTLYAPRTWRRFAHSQSTRCWLRQQRRQADITQADPITGFFWGWRDRKHTPKETAEFLSLYLEITANGQPSLAVGEQAEAIRADVVVDDPPGQRGLDTAFLWSPTPYPTPRRFRP